ncbi:hypothetical protein Tco_1253933 [Tanacetum coccineum]
MPYLVPLIAVVFVVVVGCYLASVPREEDHQYIIVILGLIVPLIIVAIGVEVFWKKLLPGKLLEVFCISISVEERLLVAKERKFLTDKMSNAARESCNSDIRSSLSSVSTQRVSISTSMSSSRAVTSFGLSFDVSDAGLPSEKGSELILVQVIGLPERFDESSLLRMECPVAASCSGELSGMLLESV